jgi:hypothetical protein
LGYKHTLWLDIQLCLAHPGTLPEWCFLTAYKLQDSFWATGALFGWMLSFAWLTQEPSQNCVFLPLISSKTRFGLQVHSLAGCSALLGSPRNPPRMVFSYRLQAPRLDLGYRHTLWLDVQLCLAHPGALPELCFLTAYKLQDSIWATGALFGWMFSFAWLTQEPSQNCVFLPLTSSKTRFGWTRSDPEMCITCTYTHTHNSA